MSKTTKETYSGGIKIEKTNAPVKTDPVATVKKNTEISYNDLVETVFAYMTFPMCILGEERPTTCKLCGAPLSYSHRHICPKCWAKVKDKALAEMKKASTGMINL